MTQAQWRQLSKAEQHERLRDAVCDSICPVMCKCDEGECGCEVEPDGECEHGCESLLLALGMI